MNSTFGAPSRARTGAGQAGVDSSAVRPITPGNATPGPYSTTGMQTTPAVRPLPLWPISCGARPEPASPATDGADHIVPGQAPGNARGARRWVATSGRKDSPG